MKTVEEVMIELGIQDEKSGLIERAMCMYADQFKALISADAGEREVVNHIENGVCAYFGVTVDMIRARDNRRNIVEVRAILFYLIRLETTMTLTVIGDMYGRDHATILNSNKSVENRLDTDKAFLRRLTDIVNVIFPAKKAKEILGGKY